MATVNSLGFSRLGIVVGKKAVNHAADRNKIKRSIRESFRSSELPALDVIVLVRKGIHARSEAEQQPMFKRAFHDLVRKLP